MAHRCDARTRLSRTWHVGCGGGLAPNDRDRPDPLTALIKRGGRRGRFENSPAPETIGIELVASIQSQSLTEELESAEEPIKTDRTR